MRWASAIVTGAFVLSAAVASHAQSSESLAQATLEDLLNMTVTSASKKEQRLFRTPAAVQVVTSEDIRRSGATSIPDVLRLVPGLQVNTIDGNKWAVSARGFNGLFANKLLVLVDGRVVYTPVSSGVHWDMLDLMLDDIERIEVIRGPGASVWGANAVNGVINIISKAAGSTQGGLLKLGAGSLAPGIAAFRYGGSAGAHGHYRVFGKHTERGAMSDEFGEATPDSSEMTSAGFRFDVDPGGSDAWTIQGSALTGKSGQRIYDHLASYAPGSLGVIDGTSPATAGNLLARWTRTPSSSSQLTLQAFWDRSYRLVVNKGETTQTFDVEFQHRFKAGGRHEVVWGAGQRFWSDREDSRFAEYFDPSSSRRRLFNIFVQDEIAFPDQRLYLTAGTKIEHQNSSGIEIQPSVRLAWLPTTHQTAWAAVSRAARTPSRLERALHVDFAAFPGADGQLTVMGVRGDPNLATEHSVSYEAGYRINPGAGISFEGTAFYNVYSDLVTEKNAVRFETAPAPAHLALIRQITSDMNAEIAGVEALMRWRPVSIWTIDASIDWLHARFENIGDTPEAASYANRNPSHQARVRSQLNLPGAWQLDAAWTYMARLDGIDVPALSRVDLRIGRTIAPGLAFSVAGQNLQAARHREFGGYEGVFHSYVPRSVVATATWSF